MKKPISFKKVNFRLRLIIILPLLFVVTISGYGIVFLYNLSQLLYSKNALFNLQIYVFLNVIISFCIGLALTYALLMPFKKLAKMAETMRKDGGYNPVRKLNFEEEIEEVFQSFEELHTSLENKRKREIIQRLTSLGQLAAGVAHEIRNPLGSIKGLVSLINEDLKEDAPHKKYIDVILNEATRMENIITRFLSLTSSKYNADIEYDDLCLNELLDEILSLAKFNPLSLNIEVEKRYNGEIKIKGDKEKLSHVFLNIILNAYQSMSEEGGKLKVYLNKTNDNKAEIKFVDTGSGIDQKNLNNIFDPFFTTKADGSGLGLSIAHQIISSHNGEIKAESLENKGAEFTILLPGVKV